MIRDHVRRRIRGLGWDVRRWPDYWDGAGRRSVLLTSKGVDLVLDVGANVGQYALELREYGFNGSIVSFEPMRQAYNQLLLKSNADPRWTCVRSAAGSESGQIDINVATNSISSSILPMLARHSAAAPSSEYTRVERVPINRLDDMASKAVHAARSVYLKIDTQGYEMSVLRGAEAILTKVGAVEIELSFVPLYQGQTLWQDQVSYLEACGFRLAGLNGGFWDRKSGETLQADGIFVRDV